MKHNDGASKHAMNLYLGQSVLPNNVGTADMTPILKQFEWKLKN